MAARVTRRTATPHAANAQAAARTTKSPKIGVALAGGAFLGAAYELGALVAIDEAIPGLDLTRAHAYVGVSVGAFIAASLANGVHPVEMTRRFVQAGHPESVDPAQFLHPDTQGLARSVLGAPRALAGAAWHYFTQPTTVMASLQRLGRNLPTGIFSAAQAEATFKRLFNKDGRTNDFRKLGAQLRIVATDIDNGEFVEFGAPGYDHVPISRAVLASGAVPGVFRPVRIDGRHYVDGAVRRTLHATAPLDAGADLLFAINPIVPLNAKRGKAAQAGLAAAGLPSVLSQTFRSAIHSRMTVGMARYDLKYPKADIILIEPEEDDDEMFFTNIFVTAGRRRLCEHAYQATRAQLYVRRDEIATKLARHGLTLDTQALNDPARSLITRIAESVPQGGLAQATALLTEALSDASMLAKRSRRAA